MRRRTAMFLALAAAAAAVGTLTVWYTRSSPGVAGQAPPRFVPGVEYRYALTWQSTQHGVIGAGSSAAPALLAEIDVAATLVLRGVRDDGARSLVEARLEPGSRYAMTVLGRVVYPDAAAFAAVFAGRTSYMEVDRDGRVAGLRFSAADSTAYKDTMQWLLTQTQFLVPAGAADDWRADEPGPFGASRTHYHRADAAGAIVRERDAYTATTLPSGVGQMAADAVAPGGATHGEFDAFGQLVRLAMDERVTARGGARDELATIVLRLELSGTSRGAAAPVDLAGLEARTPGVPVLSDDTRKRMLTQTAAGLTGEALVADLLRYNGTGPDSKEWMWHAVGLLELDPEVANLLIEPFAKLAMSGKQVVLDLLASAATPEAQEVMRILLADPALRRDGHYPLLVQRLSLVATPEPENAEYLLASFRTARGGQPEVSNASLVALGSTVGHLATSSDTEFVATSQRYSQVLRDELGHMADDPAGRAAAIMALGNTKLAENAPVIVEHTRDPSGEVRANAAIALRSYGDDGSFAALLALAADPDSGVQLAALSAIGDRTLSPSQLAALLDLVVAGRTAPITDVVLVGVLGRYVGASPRMADALRFLFERNQSDTRLRAAILGMLGQIS